MTKNDIKTTVEELSKVINIKNVIGEPIETDDKILIPVMRMGVGFGAAGVTGEKNAAGAGAGVEPISMVVIPKNGSEGLNVINISKGNEMNKAINELGLVITDVIKQYINNNDTDDIDESEYIEPEVKHINIDD